MNTVGLPAEVQAELARILGGMPLLRPVAGGDVARAFELRRPGVAERAFLKWMPGLPARLIAAESEGLLALSAVDRRACRIPAVLAVRPEDGWLLLEWLDMDSRPTPHRLAEAFAAVHTQAGPRWGWPDETALGRIMLPAPETGTAAAWLAASRIEPLRRQVRPHLQHELAALLDDLRGGGTVAAALNAGPGPVLVHGDAWGGNHAALADGTPVLFDPSPAWAFPEYDIGFARGFGAFDARFFAAWKSLMASQEGGEIRARCGELVLMLVHLAMFGAAYESRCRRILGELGL